jgi:hypothetical protein
MQGSLSVQWSSKLLDKHVTNTKMSGITNHKSDTLCSGAHWVHPKGNFLYIHIVETTSLQFKGIKISKQGKCR